MILAGDIGGTKTNLALFERKTGPHAPLAEQSFVSVQYSGLEAMVQAFCARYSQPIEAACFGVAGPVVHGRATITNLPWVIAAEPLVGALAGAQVTLINDLQAIAQAVPYLEATDVATLNSGEALEGGAIAVIAPGTGLGEAFLTWDQGRYRAHPSEGGHSSFAPTTKTEAGLLSYLLEAHHHVSYERVCSGMGIPNIYAYFRERVFKHESPQIAERLAQVSDPTPVIVAGALDGAMPCPLCVATLDCFIGILGSEIGNLAMKVMATGGVYLGGGIPPRLLPQLRQPPLLEAMRNKGRFRGLMERIPLHVILNPKTALYGAAAYAMME
ncbi:glucokinase [Candidatus Viridilinea mediisalina]|uniref:Glucokinase n=1 Tax=Candidatus Viridilinea mediisalina TaxID=2024553 RepID=A0A2A6REE6_9CHLR|nr:glucokinase [Candidatus Viridilinea mediisalina]PDW00822.1 glucokinase [Candidatus Viridilinea mediisalina]